MLTPPVKEIHTFAIHHFTSPSNWNLPYDCQSPEFQILTSSTRNLDRLYICLVVCLAVCLAVYLFVCLCTDNNVTQAFAYAQVTKPKMLPKLKCYQHWNVTKTEISSKLKCLQNLNIPKTQTLPKLKFYQNYKCKQNVQTKLKCHQNWYVNQTFSGQQVWWLCYAEASHQQLKQLWGAWLSNLQLNTSSPHLKGDFTLS